MKTKPRHYIQQLLLFFMLSLIMLPIHAEYQPNSELSGIAKEINTILIAEQNPYLIRSSFPNRVDDLTSLYKLSNNQLIWLGHEHSEKIINDALNLLIHADQQGLNPTHYDVETLQQKLASALKLNQDAYLQLALYDTALSLSLLRFAHDLHYGTIDPKTINFNLKLRSKKTLDLPNLITQHIAAGTLAQLPADIEPKIRQYAKLKQALTRYTALLNTAKPFTFSIAKSLRPGHNHPQIEELQQFLIAVGDLTQTDTLNHAEENATEKTPLTKTVTPVHPIDIPYSDSVVAAVKKFQKRHGLPSNGIIDKDTANAINVPLEQRVTQIKLAMERLRWLPEFEPGQAIIVNIPAFQLWAFDNIEEEQSTVLNTRVVVGKSPKNQTPTLMADMRLINFLPYWNVPSTILKEEILPKLARGRNFLAQQDMEIVANFGNTAKSIPLNAASIEKLRRGIFRLRQRPGKSNALGKIKFIFPNKNDVYLHDTPSKSLFSRTRRDFSHGCIRVEHPEKLAEFIFKNQKKWNKAAIQQAMKNTKMQEVSLAKPIPVLLFYSTSFFDEANNLMFYPDIYDRDPELITALKKPEDLSDQVLFAPPKLEPMPTPVPVPVPVYKQATSVETTDMRPTQLMQ